MFENVLIFRRHGVRGVATGPIALALSRGTRNSAATIHVTGRVYYF